MGNRSFLSLGTREQIDAGDGQPFADANNSFPTLWRLLLADGEPTAANTDQRVFGDAGTLNLSSRASAAIARLRQLADGVRHHPLHDSQPYLDLHFEALIAHCEAEIAALAPTTPDDAWFSANLDELSWLDGDAPDDFVDKERAACNAVATGVTAALDTQNFPALDHLLEIDSYGATFADWRSWAWNFGFGGIDHPYFAMRDEPRTIAFSDFHADDDDADDAHESYLGNGLERLHEDGRVGVLKTAEVVGLRIKDVPHSVLIPPEWDAIESAGHSKQPLFWVTRDGRTGLLRADTKGTTLLHPCDLDEAWSFERVGGRQLAIARIGDDLGLLADDGAWIAHPDSFEPPLTEVWQFEGTHTIGASGDRQGVIGATGGWSVPPTFLSVDNLQESGVAIARDDTGARLIDARTGEFSSPPMAHLEWLAWPGVFEGRETEEGSTGWWRADGRVLIAAAWDELELLQEKPWLVRVVRDGLSGIRDRDDRERIPAEWESLTARADGALPVMPDHLDEVIAGRGGKFGLLDGHGRELIPLQYDALGNFPGMSDGDDELRVPADLLQLMRETTDGPRLGAWHLGLQREIIPCRYDHLHAITLYRERKVAVPGFLAVQHAPGDERGDRDPLRVGLLRADGSVLHEASYAWIAKRHHVTEYVDAVLVARALAKAWSADEPVQAAPSTGNEYVWLYRDGRVESDLATRTAQFRAGDFTAAHAIACQYRDGDGVPQDAALSRRWMLLAAGQPESAFDTPSPGLFRRLLGAKPPSALFPASPDPRGDVQAMCDLCQLLINGSQDPDELAAARAWMEVAVTRDGDGSRGNAEAHMLLGFLLLEGIGGPQDEPRALELSSQAAAMGNTTASFNLGLIYEYGRGTTRDRARAIRHYSTASKADDLGADLNLGRLLLTPPMEGGTVSAKELKQAVYHLQRATDCITVEIAAAAKSELGQLYWSGTGVKRDRTRATALLREASAEGNASAAQFLIAQDEGGSDG